MGPAVPRASRVRTCARNNTTDNPGGGDANLNALIAPRSTFDAAVLQFNFVPEFNLIRFDYVFSSDEYNEYANTEFDDVFGFFVNGVNCATVPGSVRPSGCRSTRSTAATSVAPVAPHR